MYTDNLLGRLTREMSSYGKMLCTR